MRHTTKITEALIEPDLTWSSENLQKTAGLASKNQGLVDFNCNLSRRVVLGPWGIALNCQQSEIHPNPCFNEKM